MSSGTDTWTFKDDEIANTFDHHVRTQLPFYDMVLDSLASIIKNFLPKGGHITDIGCSTGNLYFKLIDDIKERNAVYHGVDSSKEMIQRFQERCDKFSPKPKPRNVLTDPYRMIEMELDEFWENGGMRNSSLSELWAKPNVFVMNLTFMFLSPDTREKWLEFMKSQVRSHGAVIIVDKCREEKGHLSTIYQRMLWDFKSKNYSLEDIVKKELSLRGVQIPERRKLFIDHGFDEWFRYGDFSGFIYLQ